MPKAANGAREKKIADVENGRLQPQDAERWAKEQGQEPFSSKPDVAASEVWAVERWTLPMAAAWFIWRSPDAVRDQWNRAREGWRTWHKVVHSKKMSRPRRPAFSWRLQCFGRATLADVFSQAGCKSQIPVNAGAKMRRLAGAKIHQRGWREGRRADTSWSGVNHGPDYLLACRSWRDVSDVCSD